MGASVVRAVPMSLDIHMEMSPVGMDRQTVVMPMDGV